MLTQTALLFGAPPLVQAQLGMNKVSFDTATAIIVERAGTDADMTGIEQPRRGKRGMHGIEHGVDLPGAGQSFGELNDEVGHRRGFIGTQLSSDLPISCTTTHGATTTAQNTASVAVH